MTSANSAWVMASSVHWFEKAFEKARRSVARSKKPFLLRSAGHQLADVEARGRG